MTISVTVKPGSKKGPLFERGTEDALIVYVPERAAEGRANEAVIKVVAGHFGVPKTSVNIVRGHTSRHKIIHINRDEYPEKNAK